MNRSFALALALAAAVTAFALPAAADDGDELTARCPANLPAALAPAADQRLRFVLPANGVQIYMCTLNAAGTGQWSFVAPQANLFNDDGDMKGTHFIGPVWQHNDGSSVKAAKVAGVSVDPTAVPWLLLRAVSNVGPGKFSEITALQRLNTVGGLAPASSTCTSANVGAIAQVSYTTDYFLYDTRAPSPHQTNAQCR